MIKKVTYFLIPYTILLIVSLIGNYLYFYNGLNKGDDFNFHFANIYEQYLLLKQGSGISPISGYIAMGLGSGTRLFYSPLPHFIVALTAFLFNLSIINAYKIIVILTVFISAIFMYRFALHFTNNKKIIALIAAICFSLYPYRSFDTFHRIAFAETFAIMFLPLFFMGLYDITHFKEKINILAFVEVILGGSLLYLSHNITAMFAYVAGVIYLLFNIKNIIRLIKNKRYILYCFCSFFLLVGIASIAFVSQFEHLSLDIYNVSSPKTMWTNIEAVMNRSGEQFTYSGFLNVPVLSYYYPEIYTKANLILGVISFVVFSFIFIALDKIFEKIIKIKHLHFVVSFPILILLVSIIDKRIEMYLATLIFIMIYLYVYFSKEEMDIKYKSLFKCNLFYYSVFMVLLCFAFMEFGYLWKIVPSIFLNIQFPWRLWTLVQLFASIFIALLAYYLNYKKIFIYISCVLLGLLMVANQPLVDNRTTYDTHQVNNWEEVIDESYLDNQIALGFNKEYLPKIYLDFSYESEYDNSIFNSTRYKMFSDYSKIEDYSYTPVILKGNGVISVESAFADNQIVEVKLNDESLIQMPLIYYLGYEIIAYDIDNSESIKLEPLNIDGFVSFNLKEGNYKITTNFKGTPLRIMSIVVCIVSSICTLIALIFGINEVLKNKKYNNLQK